jgi:hypothetical protein
MELNSAEGKIFQNAAIIVLYCLLTATNEIYFNPADDLSLRNYLALQNQKSKYDRPIALKMEAVGTSETSVNF